jgi:hypothetical protein
MMMQENAASRGTGINPGCLYLPVKGIKPGDTQEASKVSKDAKVLSQ